MKNVPPIESSIWVLTMLLPLSAALFGCHSREHTTETADVKANGNTVIMRDSSPQRAGLTVEPVEVQHPASVPLAGRLVWDENATVRVFTPFAGIVRKLLVDVNQPVTKGQSLAEIQSADFAQVQAEARKATSDFRRAERALARIRELFEHGAAPRKDLESAEADFASTHA